MFEPKQSEWLEAMKPDWAASVSDGTLQPNQQLCTRDGRRVGNAVIVRKLTKADFEYWAVLTDIGTLINFTDNEIDELFYRGPYLMHAHDVEARYAKAMGTDDV